MDFLNFCTYEGNDIDKYWEKDWVKFFNKIQTDGDNPFHIPEFETVELYDQFFLGIYHGLIYNFFKEIFKEDKFNKDEYVDKYIQNIQVGSLSGNKVVYFKSHPILEIGKYTHKGGAICEYIKPLFTKYFENGNKSLYLKEAENSLVFEDDDYEDFSFDD